MISLLRTQIACLLSVTILCTPTLHFTVHFNETVAMHMSRTAHVVQQGCQSNSGKTAKCDIHTFLADERSSLLNELDRYLPSYIDN